jgi:hypothetical protein
MAAINLSNQPMYGLFVFMLTPPFVEALTKLYRVAESFVSRFDTIHGK